MTSYNIDIQSRLVATHTRKRLAQQFAGVCLKRRKKGIPLSPKWKTNWKNFIERSVKRAVNEYLDTANKI